MIDTTQFPFELLEEFGLTQSMIEDLPEHVLDTILSGGCSPLLPIIVKAGDKTVKLHTKFCLMNNLTGNGNYDIVFYPKLNEAPIDEFTEEQQKKLLDGYVIIADMSLDDTDSENLTQCFVQIDKDTNHVFYVPTPVIGRNLRLIDEVMDFSVEDFTSLKSGNVITMGDSDKTSLGIDLFHRSGVFVCDGDADTWHRLLGKTIPKYNFGVEGCWVNKDGELNYIKEDCYTPEIIEVQQKMAEKYEKAIRDSEMEGIGIHPIDEQDINNQITR